MVLLLFLLLSCSLLCNPFAFLYLFPVCADLLPPLFALLSLGQAEGERHGQERSVGEWVDIDTVLFFVIFSINIIILRFPSDSAVYVIQVPMAIQVFLLLFSLSSCRRQACFQQF